MKIRPVLWVVAAAVTVAVMMFATDPASAAGALLLANAPLALGPAQFEILEKAFQEHGLKLKEFMEKQGCLWDELKNRVLDVEQKMARRPGVLPWGSGDGNPIAELAQLIVDADQTQAYLKRQVGATVMQVPAQQFKAAIVNATGASQPLVVADRRPGIVAAPQRRFTIRDLFSQVRTEGNRLEFTRELVYTNNAGPQYDGSSPGPQRENVAKNESGFTFELASADVITIAHWVPASRQVLADAAQLERYLNDRLLYGVKLAEEDQLLNGTGAAGDLNGLINQATAFGMGSTGLLNMDALALSVAQLAAAEYMASGFVLNPLDWWSEGLRLKKDTQGRYILGDPQEMVEPRLWGLPCVVTNAMPRGKFVTLDAPRTGFVADREDANVRMSDQHADFFIKNMVAILAEERISLVVERPSAIIYGTLPE